MFKPHSYRLCRCGFQYFRGFGDSGATDAVRLGVEDRAGEKVQFDNNVLRRVVVCFATPLVY